ncbi:dipeptidyl peptidase IV N-terminal region-domain-containing protein [Lasiosphaeris hirsuta]|uniref:Probable dipeptidyl-aminopeptidase B n=1 Tax=Lasiosphaeris hirsuta TaxID=260670 RepID=A0AA40DUQ6_9PEZI|nr:dipeptidyl peptidase IV N-terminal region-domain-containing protein [Lasiosphaeris hirsuta]
MQWLISLCLTAAAITAIEPPRFPHQPVGNGDTLLTYNSTVASPASLRSSTTSVIWTSSTKDGEFITRGSDGSLIFQDVVNGNQTTFLSASKVPANAREYWISADRAKILWAVNATSQYRYSYFADFIVEDVGSGKTESLVPGSAGDVQFATWNPVSSSEIAFVRGNNLFLWSNSTVSQITTDGGPDKFNAVPDWVYEEEIFGSNYALWYSPDGEYIAYLSFDETGVETFTVPYYMVGTKNPVVSFNLLNVSDRKASHVSIDAWPTDELIIGEVAWVTDAHDNVVVRAFNRVQDQEKLVVVDTATKSGAITRARDGSDGWLDNNLAISYIGDIQGGNTTSKWNGTSGPNFYLDMSDESGWNHIYLFSVDGSQKIALTSGEWEVASVLFIDTARALVYYTSTQHHSTERHLYSVSYLTHQITPLVDDTVPAVWTASFSPRGDFYILRYAGPDVPYQELYSTTSPTPLRTINDNARLYNLLKTYNLPNTTTLELAHPDGYTLNAQLRLPVNFSPDKKYPVLLNPYGGPGSQQVTQSMASLGWAAYIASDPELEYITLTVDGRGTGYKGRAFRAAVAGDLGAMEAADQIWAARELAKNAWVDAGKIGIWGWSYGGYLAAKVVEAGDPIISMGIATAPVSDWRFYDSMYTERYMKTLQGNGKGYDRSKVHDAEGFRKIAGGFLIQHGTGDDNVHFQNSAVLSEFLMGEKVSPEKLEVTWFTDSDHGINHNNAGVFLYKQLSRKLFEEKKRVGNSTAAHQWSRKGLTRTA